MLVKKVAACLSVLLLGACAGGGGGDIATKDAGATQTPVLSIAEPEFDTTSATGFLVPTADGHFPDSPVTSLNPVSFGPFLQSGVPFAYILGHDNRAFAAYAGIVPGSTVAAQPDTGTIEYHARYLLDAIVGIRMDGTVLRSYGSIGSDNDITLTADFDAGTLTGRNDADAFEVDGVLASGGTGLSGNVRWGNVEGELTGLVGSDQVIGAFHGSSKETTYAGGFYGPATR